MMRAILTLFLVAAVALGCGPAASAAPSGSPAPASADPVISAAPSASPVAVVTDPPVSEAPASPTPAEWELQLGLRFDVQVGCAPKREDLPPRALAAVECAVNSDGVARVGAYRFATEQEAAQAYIDRMGSVRVPLRSGDCATGVSGDSAWTPGDGPGEAGDILFRSGCFLDGNGIANVRLTCMMPSTTGSGTYVGLLGSNANLAALYALAWQYPEGVEMETPTPPGICFNDSIQVPDVTEPQ
jgi:hypothetical protein